MEKVNVLLTFRLLPLTSMLIKFLLIVVLYLPLSPAFADNPNELNTLLNDIAKREKSLKTQQTQQIALHEQLQQQEKSISIASNALQKTINSLKELDTTIQKLTYSIERLQKQQSDEKKALNSQLNNALKIGRQDKLIGLLDNQQRERNQRMLAYWHYLNQARKEDITELEQDLTTLTKKREALQKLQEQKKKLLDQQQSTQRKLAQAQQQREVTLAQLNLSLQKDQLALDTLKQNEKMLRQSISQAEYGSKQRQKQEANQIKQLEKRRNAAQAIGKAYTPTADEQALMARSSGLGKAIKQLNWPVEGGTLMHAFGELLRGELQWKGIVINAKEGSEVRAVANGRVLLANWLQGYGLVVVIEHGKHDLTLYGYNQNALVNVGEQVVAGQPIALVGKSGGQSQPSLYFEIRRQGQAMDPIAWLM